MFDGSTIAAISTPAGLAGRAIVRASGPKAVPVAEAVFRPAGPRLAELGGFRTIAGHVQCSGLSLPGRAYVFRAPRSYTREDVVELHLPGQPLAAGMVLEAMLAAGARPARPGQFTLRAFLNGRIDLSQAQAVADIVVAATDTQLRAATTNAGGALGALCHRWSDAAADALAEVEASIDLAEEQLELVTPAVLADRLDGLAEDIRQTLAHAVTITAAAETPRVAIAGAPNVGKSSLLNALAGLDRSIVSATAGTTRDVLTAPITLPTGRDILLADLAGLTGQAVGPAIAADAAARAALASADGVMLVVDATAADLSLLEVAAAGRPTAVLTVVANKIDLLSRRAVDSRLAELARLTHLTTIGTSAVTGDGLASLKARMAEVLGLGADRSASGCALHDRQRRAIERAGTALTAAAEQILPLGHLAEKAEITTVELRTALAELAVISGEVVTEELLGRIFARFCVGK